jgi:hypothetical protein
MTLPEAGEALDDGGVEAPHAAAGDVVGHEPWAVVDVEVMAGETAAVPDCMPVANVPADGEVEAVSFPALGLASVPCCMPGADTPAKGEVEAGAIRAPGLTRGGW